MEDKHSVQGATVISNGHKEVVIECFLLSLFNIKFDHEKYCP